MTVAFVTSSWAPEQKTTEVEAKINYWTPKKNQLK